MKEIFLRQLKGFEYAGVNEWVHSMFPSFKYSFTAFIAVVSVLSSGLERFFGLDYLAMAGFFLVMVIELVSGITASAIKKEKFSSARLSRFTFKVFYYLVLISAPFLLASFYRSHHAEMTASVYEWLQTFLIMQIFFENFISVLENISVIDGKDKNHLIIKIKDKLNSLI